MLGRRLGTFTTHLFLLITSALLITDVARGGTIDKLELEEVMEVEEGYGGGTEEDTIGARVEAETRGGGVGETVMGGGSGEPVVVKNGTVEAVVLDCPLNLNDEDLNGLHIKWYHSSTANPIYMWIPPKDPVAALFLEDRVDLTYEASQDENQKYRALRILEPTTDLSGNYECRVGSFSTELEYTQELIVYTEPQGVEVWAEEREEGQVAVFCRVDAVYPQPKLSLYKKSSVKDSEELSGGTPITSSNQDTYTMQVENMVQEATLEGPTEFVCHVTIPNTDLRFVSSTKYQPRVSVTTGAVIGGSSTCQASAVLLTVLSVIPLSRLYA